MQVNVFCLWVVLIRRKNAAYSTTDIFSSKLSDLCLFSKMRHSILDKHGAFFRSSVLVNFRNPKKLLFGVTLELNLSLIKQKPLQFQSNIRPLNLMSQVKRVLIKYAINQVAQSNFIYRLNRKETIIVDMNSDCQLTINFSQGISDHKLRKHCFWHNVFSR